MADDKPNREDLLAHESDILRGLLEAADRTRNETKTIEIARDGRVLFAFRIRPLTEAEQSDCSDKATRFHKVKEWGNAEVPEKTDQTLYRSYLIHRATVDEDRVKLWDNKEAWRKLNVPDGPQLIDCVLLAGEKAAVVEKILDISGFRDDLFDLAKN